MPTRLVRYLIRAVLLCSACTPNGADSPPADVVGTPCNTKNGIAFENGGTCSKPGATCTTGWVTPPQEFEFYCLCVPEGYWHCCGDSGSGLAQTTSVCPAAPANGAPCCNGPRSCSYGGTSSSQTECTCESAMPRSGSFADGRWHCQTVDGGVPDGPDML